MNTEKIMKLILQGNYDDIILGVHFLLENYSKEQLIEIFTKYSKSTKCSWALASPIKRDISRTPYKMYRKGDVLIYIAVSGNIYLVDALTTFGDNSKIEHL